MLRSQLKLGDILLLKDTPDNTTVKHKGIKFGQKLTSMNASRDNQGRADLVHALISISYGAGASAVAEASGGAGAVQTATLSYGTYQVYSCTDRTLAERAAQAALLFSQKRAIGYAKRKAIASIFHSDTLGKHGQERAQAYATATNSDAPAFGHGRAFCSEFVIACYQAAALNLGMGLTGAVLGCDAKHSSVRALHDRLLHDANLFPHAGDLRIQDVPGLSVPNTPW